jgi:hypothetical protein
MARKPTDRVAHLRQRADMAARSGGAVQQEMSSPEGITHYRKRVAEELRDYSRNLEARRKERTERLART